MCFYQVDSLKIEKEKAMLGYLRSRSIGDIFRILEFLFAILFFTWSFCLSSPYFSAFFQLFGVFLRRLCTLVVNHHFVFLIGNGIIGALFVKFGQFASDNQNADDENSSADEDFQIGGVAPPYDLTSCNILPRVVTVPDERQIIPAEKEIPVVEERKKFPTVKREPEVKRYRRSRSNVIHRKKTEEIRFRRSETEPRRNSVKETAPIRRNFDVENLSSEEFRQKVEAVIEQHRRSLRQESLFSVSA